MRRLKGVMRGKVCVLARFRVSQEPLFLLQKRLRMSPSLRFVKACTCSLVLIGAACGGSDGVGTDPVVEGDSGEG